MVWIKKCCNYNTTRFVTTTQQTITARVNHLDIKPLLVNSDRPSVARYNDNKYIGLYTPNNIRDVSRF